MKSQCRNLGWFPSAGTSYIGYLQQAQLADSIRFEIRKNTKAIIASDREIAQCHFRILEGINRDVQEGIVTLSLDIQSLRNAVTEGFQELGAIFEWGFSEVLLSLGRIGDQLSDLIRIAKTPAQTWAFEQFEIARDEFRRGLFEEALESVQRAIGGHGSNPGYKTEFRFYSLLGLIRLGNHKNNSPEIVDPASAEDAFLSAGRYAKHDYPKEAARAYCYGGRAAYVQKHLHNARDHTSQALAYDDKFAEAHFQMAQVLCALNEPQQGMTHLRMSVMLDKDYAIRAAADGEIRKYQSELNELLKGLVLWAEHNYQQSAALYDEYAHKLTSLHVERYAMTALCEDKVATIERYRKQYQQDAMENTLFGYINASKKASEKDALMEEALGSYKEKAISETQRRLSEIETALTQKQHQLRESPQAGPAYALIGLLIVLLILWTVWNSFSSDLNPLEKILNAIAMLIGGAISGVLAYIVVAGVLALLIFLYGIIIKRPIVGSELRDLESKRDYLLTLIGELRQLELNRMA